MIPVRPETDRLIGELLTRYPQQGTALLPALYAIQDELGHITPESMAYVAGKFGVSEAFVAGVVSFYTMFHRKPVGKHHIQVCRTLSCALRGAGEILRHLESRLGIKEGGRTPDGRYSLIAVECLGACDTAPMCQVNDKEHGLLDPKKADELIRSLG